MTNDYNDNTYNGTSPLGQENLSQIKIKGLNDQRKIEVEHIGDYYVQDDVSCVNEALRSKHHIKNTLQKMFKYGSSDIYRIQNTLLIEKYDPELTPIECLKNEPIRFGNQKRKRMLKHYEKV